MRIMRRARLPATRRLTRWPIRLPAPAMNSRAQRTPPDGSVTGLLRTYGRALALLRSEWKLALRLSLANVVIAFVQLAEPVLFGAVVDSLTKGGAVFELIWLWAVLGVGGIAAGVIVSLYADRLAHRRRTAALAEAFERVITLPMSYHARAGSGRLVRTLVAGTDSLFLIWLGFFREHLSSVIGIAFLVPTALFMDVRLAGLLALLAVLYVGISFFVVRRTQAGQQAVERHHQDVFGRVGDVIGNVTVVQSYARLAAEASELQELIRRLLAAQLPVLTWWATLTILTRASATIVMVVIFGAGAVLARAGEVSVGEIVSFIGFANLLIGRLDQITGFLGRLFIQAPTVDGFFELMAAEETVRDAPDARVLSGVRGPCRVRAPELPLPGLEPGRVRPLVRGAAGPDRGPGGAHGLRQDHDHGPAPAPARPGRGPDHDRRHRHPRDHAGLAAARDGRGVPGGRAVQPLDPGQPPGRQGLRHAGRDRGRGPAGRGARLHHAEGRAATTS